MLTCDMLSPPEGGDSSRGRFLRIDLSPVVIRVALPTAISCNFCKLRMIIVIYCCYILSALLLLLYIGL